MMVCTKWISAMCETLAAAAQLSEVGVVKARDGCQTLLQVTRGNHPVCGDSWFVDRASGCGPHTEGGMDLLLY